MASYSYISNKNTLWSIAVVVGVVLGLCFGGLTLFFFHLPSVERTPLILLSTIFGLVSGLLLAWMATEIIKAVIRYVISDLNEKVGLKLDSFTSTQKGLSGELDLFDQVFQMILSVLKRVLLISLKLEKASTGLDKTAQISSQVIKEIVEGVNLVNQKALDNATNLRETIRSLESNYSLSKDVSSKLIIAKSDSLSVAEVVASAQSSVKQAVDKMLKIKELTDGSTTLVNDLNDRSKQIGTILTEIANIAEKTNLLALNAAIEAARAGEQGRGFAVVAEEVRKLARGSADSSKKINNLINVILQKTENAAEMMQTNTIQVNEGMELINTVDSTLGSVVQTSEQLNAIVSNISLSANKQSETSDSMYQNVNNISNSTDEISDQIQTIAQTALSKTVIVDQTSTSAKDLRTLSDVFQNALVPFEFHVVGAVKRSAIRTETRIPCKFKILLTGEMIDNTLSGSYTMRGIITSLSAGGCVLKTREDIEQGKYIILVFQIASDFIQGIQGRLVRINKSELQHYDGAELSSSATHSAVDSSESDDEVKDCVISFTNLSSEHEKIISEFVVRAQRQFEINLGITDSQWQE